MSDYPEHDKLRAVKDQSQAIGEFIDWLRSPIEDGGKGVHLQTWQEFEDDELCSNCHGEGYVGFKNRRKHCTRCGGTGRVDVHHEGLFPFHANIQDLLAEFFKIDRKKIDAEKDQMLAAIREANEAARVGGH